MVCWLVCLLYAVICNFFDLFDCGWASSAYGCFSLLLCIYLGDDWLLNSVVIFCGCLFTCFCLGIWLFCGCFIVLALLWSGVCIMVGLFVVLVCDCLYWWFGYGVLGYCLLFVVDLYFVVLDFGGVCSFCFCNSVDCSLFYVLLSFCYGGLFGAGFAFLFVV